MQCSERSKQQQRDEDSATKRLETEKWVSDLHLFVSNIFVV
jgi:hypothetical protein